MPNVRSLSKSFSGGEITPEMYGRIDDSKFQTGLALCRNFIVLPHGPVVNRNGLAYVAAAKHADKYTRLIPFTYSTDQTFAIQVGEGYFRFHTQGGTLLAGSPAAYNGATAYVVGDLVSSAGTNYYCVAATTGNAPPNATYWYPLPSAAYEIPNPYTEAYLADLHYVQSNDVLTIVHPLYAPRELRRLGAAQWVLSTISFASSLPAPSGVTATPTGTGSTTYYYKVTAIGEGGTEESLASTAASCVNNLLTSGQYNTITFPAVSGAIRYNIYKQDNGLYGYLGQTDGLSFVDDNITADLSKTPPIATDPFVGANNYPGAVSYAEQRRVFAGTYNKPQNLWFTRAGTESNMAYSLPTTDEDAIAFRVAAREANTIRHIVPVANLILLTSSAEWRATPVNSDVITPTTISVRPQSYVGANEVQPVIVNNNVIYGAARGGHIRELGYSWQQQSYATGDMSLRAPHLFDGYEMLDLAYTKAPYPIVWAPYSSKSLIGCTYVPEQQIGPWHRHDTYTAAGQSTIESCCAVAEGTEDVLYASVVRVINGATVRYIERLGTARPTALEDSFFVDCGATYDGAPATSVSGLTWLEGETVSILADGAVCPRKVVAGGAVTLPAAASKVHIGLPITADIQTLPLAFEALQAFGQGRVKNINRVWVRVHQSSGLFAGPDFDTLTEAKLRTDELYGQPPRLRTGEIEIDLAPSWSDSGQVCLRQSNPLPLLVTSLTMEASIGG